MASAVRFHHNAQVFGGDDDPLVSLVALADAMAGIQGAEGEPSVTTPEFLALIKASGFDVETVGEGTTFRICLPLIGAPIAELIG